MRLGAGAETLEYYAVNFAPTCLADDLAEVVRRYKLVARVNKLVIAEAALWVLPASPFMSPELRFTLRIDRRVKEGDEVTLDMVDDFTHEPPFTPKGKMAICVEVSIFGVFGTQPMRWIGSGKDTWRAEIIPDNRRAEGSPEQPRT